MTSTLCAPCPESAHTRQRPSRPSPFGRRHPVLDTNVGAFSPACSRTARDALTGCSGSDSTGCSRRARVAAETSVAFMELGALVCTASSPACGRCPLRANAACMAVGGRCPRGAAGRRMARRAPSGQPELAGAPRRPPYRGSVREARGLVLAALRSSPGPVAAGTLSNWPAPTRRGAHPPWQDCSPTACCWRCPTGRTPCRDGTFPRRGLPPCRKPTCPAPKA